MVLPASRVLPPSRRARNWNLEEASTWEHHPQPTIPPPRLNRQAESRRQSVGCISRGWFRPHTRRKDPPILSFLLFFHLTYSRWTSSLPSCLRSQRIFPSLPGSRLTIFLSRCKFSTLTTRQPMVEFYLLTFPRFPLRKKEPKSYFGKNRTHDFRTN